MINYQPRTTVAEIIVLSGWICVGIGIILLVTAVLTHFNAEGIMLSLGMCLAGLYGVAQGQLLMTNMAINANLQLVTEEVLNRKQPPPAPPA